MACSKSSFLVANAGVTGSQDTSGLIFSASVKHLSNQEAEDQHLAFSLYGAGPTTKQVGELLEQSYVHY